MKKMLPLLVLVPFTALSLVCAIRGGVSGLAVFKEPWALQFGLDLYISIFFVGGWIRRDARERGIESTPWLVMLPFLGSIATLLYMVRRTYAPKRAIASAGARGAPAILHGST